jgi:hypothetical protein
VLCTLAFASLAFASLAFASLAFASLAFASLAFASPAFASLAFAPLAFASLASAPLAFAPLAFAMSHICTALVEFTAPCCQDEEGSHIYYMGTMDGSKASDASDVRSTIRFAASRALGFVPHAAFFFLLAS